MFLGRVLTSSVKPPMNETSQAIFPGTVRRCGNAALCQYSYMRAVIDQFMWGFQSMFRWWLKNFADRALKKIGVDAAPEAYLVGFRQQDDVGNWPICVEPETGPYAATLFDGVEAAATILFENHPESGFMHTDPNAHANMLSGRLESFRMEAIGTAFSDSIPGRDREFFVGYPGFIGSYRIYPVISVLKEQWNSYPQLRKEHQNSRIVTRRSLQHALVAKALERASDAMSRQSAPDGFRDFGDQEGQDVIRHAAQDFVSRIAFVHAEWDSSQFSAAMEAVAAQPYEGRSGVGSIVLGAVNHVDVAAEIVFSEPVPLRQTRSFRKALEMTGESLHLLSDGVEAYGLGRVLDSYDPEEESLYTAKVIGRGSWELAHDSTPLLRVDNGNISLPREPLSKEHFFDTVQRIYGASGDAPALWDLALAASRQQHGTMLVVSSDAAAEARRLAPQALAVEPRRLGADVLKSLTAIDGAVLVSPDAECHAIGIILDGTAKTGMGDASRGARFNSAVRYHHGAAPRTCLIVIVSEDGMINLLPDLLPRVDRALVEQAVRALEDASREDIDYEIVGQRDREVIEFAFYLSKEQCARVNSARESVEAARSASGGNFIEVNPRRETPNPGMEDSYFLSE